MAHAVSESSSSSGGSGSSSSSSHHQQQPAAVVSMQTIARSVTHTTLAAQTVGSVRSDALTVTQLNIL